MRAFDKILVFVLAVIAVLFTAANILLLSNGDNVSGRPYRVEINRLALEMEKSGAANADLSGCKYVTHIEACGNDYFDTESDYLLREINGVLYRFDYVAGYEKNDTLIIRINIILGAMSLVLLAVMLYIRMRILKPFRTLTNVPYELSKGNLTPPVKETKNRFFGRFIWGIDLLRENIEQQKKRELELQKDKKMLLLSLSHDIKTPLSAIKLYSKALSKGLYKSEEKQLEIADSISAKADEIEGYVSQIITASREDFLSLDVNMGEFYLSELINKINLYYREKLELIRTDFSIDDFTNCLLRGDLDRSVEVIQNVIENAVKYGDGKSISVSFGEEDDCILISVINSGCSLPEAELPHIFESFLRGSNASEEKGSGLGLYICRRLMQKMNGEIFAEIKDGFMSVTAVFTKA